MKAEQLFDQTFAGESPLDRWLDEFIRARMYERRTYAEVETNIVRWIRANLAYDKRKPFDENHHP